MTSTAQVPRVVDVGRHVVDRFRDLVHSGGFVHAARVDKHTGEIVDPEARALFAALPTLTPATTPEELLDHGAATKLPRELQRAYDAPKYRVGRKLFVQAKVSFKDSRRGTGTHDPAGSSAFTHRGVLRAQNRDDFLVDVDGAPAPIWYPRAQVFAWNEPIGVGPSGGTISGVRIDYNDPLFKGHVWAGYLEIASELAALDFGAEPAIVRAEQERLVHALAAHVRMSYAGRGDGYGGHRAGSLLLDGQGGCFVQRAVAGAYLQVFSRVLAFEVQMAVGRTLRLDEPHGFVVVTLRPSLARFVCDPAWAEPLTDLGVAFFDANWGHDRRLVAFEGQQEITVRPSEVDLPQEEMT